MPSSNSKTLKLNIDVGLTGDKAFQKVNAALKGTDAVVTKFIHTTDKSGRFIKAQRVEVELLGKSLKELNSLKQKTLTSLEVTSKETSSKVVTDPLAAEKRIKAEIRRDETQAYSEERRRNKVLKEAAILGLQEIKRTVKDNAVVSDVIYKEQKRQLRAATKDYVSWWSSAIDARKRKEKEAASATFAGRLASTPRTITPQRRNIAQAMAQAGREQSKQIQQQDLANKKKREAIRLTNQEALARKAVTNKVRLGNQALRVSIRHQKSLLRHVFDVVAGYRLVNFAINKMQQGLAAVPQAGIQQQSNVAALQGTFGSTIGREELQFVSQIADGYGLALEELETSFVKFAPSAKLAGASLQEVNQIFEDFSAVGTVLHKTPEEMNAIFLALEQMFAKGVVQSEEIKKQLGNQLPAAVALSAEAMEMSTSAFMAAMRNNEIIATEAVPRIAALYRETLAPDSLLEKVSDQFLANALRVKNESLAIARDLFDKTKGLLNQGAKSIVSGLTVLRENLTGVGQVVKLLSALFISRLSASLVAVTAKTYAAATANIVLAKSHQGVRGAITATRMELGLFIQRFTGIPPQAAAVATSIAAVSAAFLYLGGVTISYGKGTSAELKKQKELTDAWGAALIDQQKTVKSTSEIVKNQREEAVLSTELALAEFDEIALKSNGFYLEIGEYTVTLSEFTLSVWQKMFKGMRGSFKEFTDLMSDDPFYLKTIYDFKPLEEATNVIQGFSTALANETVKTEHLAARKAKAMQDWLGGGKGVAGKDTFTQKPFWEAYLEGYSDEQIKTSLDNTANKASVFFSEAAKDASENELDQLKAKLDEARKLRIQAYEQQAKDRAIAEDKAAIARAKRNKQKALDDLRNAEKNRFGLASANIAAAEEILEAKRRAGIITETQLRVRLREEEYRRLDVLKESLSINEQLAKSDPNIQLTKTIQDQRHQIQLLGIELSTSIEKVREQVLVLGVDIRSNIEDSFANSFVSFVDGSKSAIEAMRDFATNILKQIARIAAQKLAEQVIGLAVSAYTANVGGAYGGGTNSFVGPVQQAKGGVNTGMGSATNTVLTQPTFFPNAKVTPFASGGVLAGEAGEEAVMPLHRDKYGKLGVKVSGQGGGSGATLSGIVIQQMNISVESKEDETAQEQSEAVAKAIKSQLKSLIQSEIINSKRSGNSLNPTQLQGVF